MRATGRLRIMRGVANDRMPSLGDPEMRHGRTSKAKLFDGYKRPLIKLVGAGLTVGAEVLLANHPEQEARGDNLQTRARLRVAACG